jgi:erythromycin esterase-like protein
MPDSGALLRRTGADDVSALAELLRRCGEALPPPDDFDKFGTFFDRFADAKLVLLGEATHGTSEFYQARAAITRRLVAKHGFTIVAIEADWPDAARIDRYVRHLAPRPGMREAFQRFPTWMWRNAEVMAFIDWLRHHNEPLPEERRAAFRGLDVYSLGASIEAVIAYLDRVDPAAAKAARRRYGCLTPWQDEPADYGRAVLYGGKDTCEDAAVAQLNDLLAHRMEYLRNDGEAFFDAAQNARIVRAAERYYRIMYRGGNESWNLRDRHMFDTLQALLRAGGEAKPDGAKAVVGAHNSHIGNAAATAMGWQGEFNIGELCRTAYGDAAVLIGFGTDRGTVAAADEWDGEMRVKTVVPAREDSWEFAFRKSGLARSLTDWRRHTRRELVAALREPRLERAIGVIYRPQSEFLSHYFEAVLAEQLDAFVWFEETTAVTPLPAGRPHGAPETYPFGL